MKLSEMRKKTVPALEKHAESLRIKIVDTKKAIVMTEENNHQSVKKLKRELAQTLTVAKELSNKEMEKSDG